MVEATDIGNCSDQKGLRHWSRQQRFHQTKAYYVERRVVEKSVCSVRPSLGSFTYSSVGRGKFGVIASHARNNEGLNQVLDLALAQLSGFPDVAVACLLPVRAKS